jgi:hypothetical protein
MSLDAKTVCFIIIVIGAFIRQGARKTGMSKQAMRDLDTGLIVLGGLFMLVFLLALGH